MAVAVSATSAVIYNASAATQNFTFVIGPNSGNTLALFFIAQDATQTITSVTWDQGGTNQSCTLIASEPDPTAALGKIYIYGVVNPTPGASKILRVVNGTATGVSACMQSYTGSVSSSIAAACTNALVANGTTTGSPQSVGTAAQSGASGDMYISAYVAPATIGSVSDTQIYLISPAGDDAAANRFASTGASHTLTASMSSVTTWAAVSCDIVASTGVVTPKWVPNADPKHDVAISTHAKIAAIAVAAVYAFVPFDTPQITSSVPSGWQSIALAAPTVAFINAPQLPFIVPPFHVPSGWQSTSTLTPPVAVPQQGNFFVPFNTLQTNTAFLGWYQPLATTPSSPPAQQGSALLSYNPTPIINTITGMGWFQSLAATPSSPPSQIGASFVPLNTPQISTVVSPYGWYQPLSLAPPVAVAFYPQTPWTPAPFPTFTLAWQQPLALTPTTPLVQLGSTSLTYNIQPLANTVVGMPWQQPLSTALPVAIVYQGSSFVPYDTMQTIVITTLIQRTLTGVGI